MPCTLLSLVRCLDADPRRTEAEVVHTAQRLVRSGSVVLVGNFAGCRI